MLLLRLLGLVTRPLVASRPLPRSPRRILVVRPDHIGDGLFTTPALRALREAFPESEITCLVGPWSAMVYKRNPNVDRVSELPFPGFGPARKRHLFEPYVRLWQTARRLRAEGYDLALNLRFDFWWGALLAYAVGVPARVGYAVPECAPFLSEKVAYVRGRHEAVQNLALVGAAAAGPDRRDDWLAWAVRLARLEFPVSQAETAAAAVLLEGLGLTSTPVVAIHPGTRGRAKLWTADGWASVGSALAERLGARVLVTGSAAERDLCAEVAGRMGAPAVELAGRTTVGELVALFRRCQLVLGVDSGPLHLAVAAGAPTVHLYGPSDHVAFAPFGDPALHAVVRSGRACSPCHVLDFPSESLGEHPCLREIEPSKVLAAAEAVLAAAAVASA